MKAAQVQYQKDDSVLAYHAAIKHIELVFPGGIYGFDDACIHSFCHFIHAKMIKETHVWYDKIAIEYKHSKVYWPIQPFKMVDPDGREHNYFEIFKSKESV